MYVYIYIYIYIHIYIYKNIYQVYFLALFTQFYISHLQHDNAGYLLGYSAYWTINIGPTVNTILDF